MVHHSPDIPFACDNRHSSAQRAVGARGVNTSTKGPTMPNDDQPDLANRVAIVTGAASGMGRVMARSLAAAGARIAAVDISKPGLAELVAEPVFAGSAVSAVADVSRAQDCARAVDQATGAFGRPDILINCAGV